MNDITDLFSDVYQPVSALLIHHNESVQDGYSRSSYLIEAYDIDSEGRPCNAHPLSSGEASKLAQALDVEGESLRDFLTPQGLLPENVLYINPSSLGFAIWYTPAGERDLYFVLDLGIPNGKAKVPAMVWVGRKFDLSVFALLNDDKPTAATLLYRAPLFNVNVHGEVCMGTVEIEPATKNCLEGFMAWWEDSFFNSYFSHINGSSPVKGNIVQLWQELMETGQPFPVEQLMKTGKTVENLLR